MNAARIDPLLEQNDEVSYWMSRESGSEGTMHRYDHVCFKGVHLHVFRWSPLHINAALCPYEA